jgi:hypothetical protein
MTDYAKLKKWECLDSDTGDKLTEEVRKYHILDFSNWKNHDAFDPPSPGIGARLYQPQHVQGAAR